MNCWFDVRVDLGLVGDLAGVETIELVLNNPVTLACGSFQPFTIQDCDVAARRVNEVSAGEC